MGRESTGRWALLLVEDVIAIQELVAKRMRLKFCLMLESWMAVTVRERLALESLFINDLININSEDLLEKISIMTIR